MVFERARRNLVLRGCPHCGGDLLRDVYEDDEYVCLQCAREFTQPQAEAGRQTARAA